MDQFCAGLSVHQNTAVRSFWSHEIVDRALAVKLIPGGGIALLVLNAKPETTRDSSLRLLGFGVKRRPGYNYLRSDEKRIGTASR